MIKPCIKCGATDRYVGGRCKPCTRKRKAEYRAANPEKGRVADAKYRAAHPERERERHAKDRAANPDKYRKRDAAYRAANLVKSRERGAAYYTANTEKARAATDKWQAANPEKLRASIAAWAARNPEKRRVNNHNRRARKLENGGELSLGLAARLLKLQRGKCACCKRPLGDNFHRDHIMPLALGGTNTDDNIQLLCAPCNLQKHIKHPIDFMQQRGFLL